MSDELKKALNEKTLVIGTERTIKKIKQGKVKKVFIATNCPINIKKEITQLTKIGKIYLI